MTSKTEKTLQDLFVHALKDIYFAEKAIVKALPRIAKKARHDELKTALLAHLDETKGHVERLEQVFAEMQLRPAAVRCEAIEGILKEGEEVLEEFGDSPAGDAARRTMPSLFSPDSASVESLSSALYSSSSVFLRIVVTVVSLSSLAQASSVP